MDYGEEYKEKLANLRGWNLLKEANKRGKSFWLFLSSVMLTKHSEVSRKTES